MTTTRIVNHLAMTLEDEANELDSVGESERAEQLRELALKYRQMEYNGHLIVHERKNIDGRK